MNNLKKRNIKRISEAYHKAIKLLFGLAPLDSNHIACDIVKLFIFKYLHAKSLICFMTMFFKLSSPCLSAVKYYYKFQSQLRSNIKNFFYNYQIADFDENPLCFVTSRTHREYESLENA